MHIRLAQLVHRITPAVDTPYDLLPGRSQGAVGGVFLEHLLTLFRSTDEIKLLNFYGLLPHPVAGAADELEVYRVCCTLLAFEGVAVFLLFVLLPFSVGRQPQIQPGKRTDVICRCSVFLSGERLWYEPFPLLIGFLLSTIILAQKRAPHTIIPAGPMIV